MKNHFDTILSCMLGVMILTYGFTGVTAQGSDSGTVSVQVVPSGEVGVLWASASSVDLGDYAYSPTDSVMANGTVAIGVGDLRGTASGWVVTLSGTPFKSENHSFPISNLRLSAGTIESTASTNMPGTALPQSLPLNPVATAPNSAILAKPGLGAGIFVNWRQTTLVIPAGTPIGTYQSTITVTITGSDPRPPD